MERFYAGIGSRSTPDAVQVKMREIAVWLASIGWTLRSGGADGADSAFEAGCDFVGGKKEIYLPWKKFNGNSSLLYPPTAAALELASTIHPAWHMCSHGAKLLHGRNCHQVLGQTLDQPVAMVVCWTQGGGISGGTATAMKLAQQNGARVFNLFDLIEGTERWWDEFISLAGIRNPQEGKKF